LPDTVTVNLTIPLRERKPRSWALSGGILPKAGLRASLSSRFPNWARGAVETATYLASIHLSPFTKPVFVIERPLMLGHEWLSGIAISPALSPVGMLTHYARAHIAPAIATVLEPAIDDAVIVRVATADDSSQSLECRPPKPRLWWLRRVALEVMNFAL
jgi:hypothetical protein